MRTNYEIDAMATTIDGRTLEEKVTQPREDFPYRADQCDLRLFPSGEFPWHWHREVELFLILEGSLEYGLPSGKVRFREGDVGFVNANVLHKTRCEGDQSSVQLEHIFLPSLIGGEYGSAIETRYVRPLTQNQSATILTFPGDGETAAFMTPLMLKAYGLFKEKPFAYEIGIRETMTEVWLRLLEAAGKEDVRPRRESLDDQRIKTMLHYIAEHYGSKMTLAQLASAVPISERECCRCFRRMLGESPFDYLLRFRVNRACELLDHTAEPILTIATECGFSSGSYFGKMFLETMGCSPRSYRKRPVSP